MNIDINHTNNEFKSNITNMTKDLPETFTMAVIPILNKLHADNEQTDQNLQMKIFLGMILFSSHINIFNAKHVRNVCKTNRVNPSLFYHLVNEHDETRITFSNLWTHRNIEDLFNDIDKTFADYQNSKQFFFKHY